MAAVNRKLKFVIFQQVNIISLLLLQILTAIENYQYLRTRILHMTGAYYISKQDKLIRKRKSILIRSMLRKPRVYWYEKTRTEDWWLKLIGEETSASSWKKTSA